MRAPAWTAVVVVSVLATSACASSHSEAGLSSTTKTDAIPLHESTYGPLPQAVRTFIHSTLERGTPDGPIHEIDVYGRGSRGGLVKASSGDIVGTTPKEQKERFYLFVSRGRFVCRGCSGPAGSKPPRGTIETRVWSPAEKVTDFGIGNHLPAAASRLPRLAVIELS